MAGSPLAAYSTLGNIRGASDMSRGERGFNMSKSIAEERRKEEEAREKREKNRGLGRLGGMGGGLLASLLLAPLTGGMSVPLQMLISGGISGATSVAGQKIAGGDKKIGTGQWDVAEDEKLERYNKDSVWASAGQDALSSALLTGAGGLMKYVKGGKPVSNASYVDPLEKMKQSIADKMREKSGLYDWQKQLELEFPS